MKLPTFQRVSQRTQLGTVDPRAYVTGENAFTSLAKQAIHAVNVEKANREEAEYTNGLLSFQDKNTSEKAWYADNTDENGLIDTSLLPTELSYPNKIVKSTEQVVINGVPHTQEVSKIPAYIAKPDFIKLQARAHAEAEARNITNPARRAKFLKEANIKIHEDFLKNQSTYASEHEAAEKAKSRTLTDTYKEQGKFELAKKVVEVSLWPKEKKQAETLAIDQAQETSIWRTTYLREPTTPQQYPVVIAQLDAAIQQLSVSPEEYRTKYGGKLSGVEQQKWKNDMVGRKKALETQFRKNQQNNDVLLLRDAETMRDGFSNPMLDFTADRVNTMINALSTVRTADGNISPRAQVLIADLQENVAMSDTLDNFGLQPSSSRTNIMDSWQKQIGKLTDTTQQAAAIRNFNLVANYNRQIEEAYDRNTIEGGQVSKIVPIRRTDINQQNLLTPETQAALKLFNEDATTIYNNGRGETINQLIPDETAEQIADAYSNSDRDTQVAFAQVLGDAFPDERLDGVIEHLTRLNLPKTQGYDIRIAAKVGPEIARQVILGRERIANDQTQWDNTQRQLMRNTWSEKAAMSFLPEDTENARLIEQAATNLYAHMSQGSADWDKGMFERAIELVYGEVEQIKGNYTKSPNNSTPFKLFKKQVLKDFRHQSDLLRQGYKPVHPSVSAPKLAKAIKDGSVRMVWWAENEYRLLTPSGDPIRTKQADGTEATFIWRYGDNTTEDQYQRRKAATEAGTDQGEINDRISKIAELSGQSEQEVMDFVFSSQEPGSAREAIQKMLKRINESGGEAPFRYPTDTLQSGQFIKDFFKRLKTGKRPDAN